jgi:ATP-dependent Clp protease ATP-binding subunit ClpC
MGHGYIGTEHILLGLVRENDGVAARILLDFGADAERIRGAVGELLGRKLGVPPLASRARGVVPLWAGLGLAIGILVGWLIWGV